MTIPSTADLETLETLANFELQTTDEVVNENTKTVLLSIFLEPDEPYCSRKYIPSRTKNGETAFVPCPSGTQGQRQHL